MLLIIAAFLLAEMTAGKIYDRCELAHELKFVHKAPPHQLATWVCIAEHESQYNTSIVGHLSGDGSGDHGIFQISDRYWCSPPGKGFACGLTCAELENDDISDDFICAQEIYKEHKQLSGDGFNAWAVYQPLCKGAKADLYIKDCFSDSKGPKTFTTPVPVFAHGFFPTTAEKGNKFISTSTQKPVPDAFSNFRSPSVIQSDDFAITTSKPDLNLFSTTKSPFFANRFFTSNQNSHFDLFFTPRTTELKPTVSTTAAFSTTTTTTTTRPSTSNLAIFNPTTRTPVNPSVSRSSVFELGKKFSMSPSKFIYTPTITTTLHQTTTDSRPRPVFIINGVMWN